MHRLAIWPRVDLPRVPLVRAQLGRGYAPGHDLQLGACVASRPCGAEVARSLLGGLGGTRASRRGADARELAGRPDAVRCNRRTRTRRVRASLGSRTTIHATALAR